MNKSDLDSLWSHIRRKYGIYLRLLEGLPNDKLHEQVIPGMRTPAELVAHTSDQIIREIASGVASGEIKNAPPESDVAAGFGSSADLVAFATQCWQDADDSIRAVGDEELGRIVKTPWGVEFPGSACIYMINDEFTHHRGQLYVYARLCGVEPPFMWSFEENPPGFGPTP